MNRNPLKLLLLLPLLAGPLLAYQPTRWSPLDVYVEQARAGGPVGLRVLDADGRELSAARFEYNAEGRLSRERFTRAGSNTGAAVYVYDRGRLTEERLLDAEGELLSRTVFEYTGTRLKALRQFNREGRVETSQEFRYADGRIVGGVERNGADTDHFELSYQSGRPVLLTVKDPTGQVVQTLSFSYDANNRLAARVREANGGVSRCTYAYDDSGRVTAYVYADQTAAGAWQVTRRIEILYN